MESRGTKLSRSKLDSLLLLQSAHRDFEHNGEKDMKKQAAEMANRIQRAVESGRLKLDGSYAIPELVAIIGTTRTQLCQAVNREFGSVAGFCTHIGFGAKNVNVVTGI